MFFQDFRSYTWRTVFILYQDAPRTFPTDSESMNLIRTLFLIKNQVFHQKPFGIHCIPYVQ